MSLRQCCDISVPEQGGDNTGSDWTNAYPSFSAVTWARGNTYYVASGTYEGIFSISIADNSVWLYIKKATISDHGTSTGWLDSYGNGQAVIAGQMKLFNGHIDVDGVTGSGKSGHGLKIDGSGLSSGYPSSPIFISSGAGDIKLAHIEIAGIGQVGTFEQDGVYCNSTVDVNNHHYSYLYLHDIFRNGVTWTHVNNSYIEYCYFLRQKSTIADIHAQTIQLTIPPMHDNEIRYNTFEDTSGQGQVSFLGNDSAENLFVNFRIYGNIVFSNDRSNWVNNYFVGDLGTSGPRTQNILVYNNTFFNAYGVSSTFLEPECIRERKQEQYICKLLFLVYS